MFLSRTSPARGQLPGMLKQATGEPYKSCATEWWVGLWPEGTTYFKAAKCQRSMAVYAVWQWCPHITLLTLIFLLCPPQTRNRMKQRQERRHLHAIAFYSIPNVISETDTRSDDETDGNALKDPSIRKRGTTALTVIAKTQAG